MMDIDHTLIGVFQPPEGFTGDFGAICGFTASHAALTEISNTFNGDGTRPHLVAFIHPTANSVTDIPGVTWMHFKDPPFKLLHAKVGLLGFRGTEDRYILRLLVSTGNWTQEPLTTSLDLYWFEDLLIGRENPQLSADINASAELFKWLRMHCDTGILKQRFDGNKTDDEWQRAIDSLPSSKTKPRFFDTRSKTMMDQVIVRIPKKLKAKRLVLGSGYFEAPTERKSSLISKLKTQLKSRISKRAKLDLVLNPESCQGLAGQAKELMKKGWRLRGPRKNDGNRKLHAKFLLLTKNDSPDRIGESYLYLGSGNFSKQGFTSTASNGNLEAGIVLQPSAELSWRKNANRKIVAKLPVCFDSEVDIQNLKDGADFETPMSPEDPPVVPFVVWQDGIVNAPEDMDGDVEIWDKDGNSAFLPTPWSAPAPSFVTLKAGNWKVPVYASGAFVVPRPKEMTVDDIIADIQLFPAPAEPSDSEEFECSPDAIPSIAAESPVQVYPLRRMMRLIVHLTETQKTTHLRDWPRWCREIRQTLPALAMTERDMLVPFHHAKMTPLTALLYPVFIPEGANIPELAAAIEEINAAWGLVGARDLWSESNA